MFVATFAVLGACSSDDLRDGPNPQDAWVERMIDALCAEPPPCCSDTEVDEQACRREAELAARRIVFGGEGPRVVWDEEQAALCVEGAAKFVRACSFQVLTQVLATKSPGSARRNA